jgi:hypothetical protein
MMFTKAELAAGAPIDLNLQSVSGPDRAGPRRGTHPASFWRAAREPEGHFT